MIDSDQINAAVQAKISEAVAEEVKRLFQDDAELLKTLKNQAISLIVRNFNLDNLTKQTMSKQVSDKVAELLISGDNQILNATAVNEGVSEHIAEATASYVATLIDKDAALLGHIKRNAVTTLLNRIAQQNNINGMIADKIADQFAQQFDNNVIQNDATDRELTIHNGSVVVENALVANNATINESLTAQSLNVNTLSVRGQLDINAKACDGLTSSMKNAITKDITDTVGDSLLNRIQYDSSNISFTELNVNKQSVIKGNTLGPSITESSLTKLGILTDLTVDGNGKLGVMTVRDKRVGINTETPSAALAVWEDEVEINIGKLKSQTAFIGTNRTQDLVIGVNRGEHIKIDAQGVTNIKKLKLGDRIITHGSAVPNYAGNPGDLVFNTNIAISNPVFAWFCISGFKWLPLKAVL